LNTKNERNVILGEQF